MGLFDFFTKETEVQEKKTPAKKPVGFSSSKINGSQQPVQRQQAADGNVPVRVFKPTSFQDVCAIIDFLLLNKPAIVNVEAVKDQTIQRVMDILSGACYALHGEISEISHNIYLISPDSPSI
ncbi:MAG: cell division protein SepF [Clostridia bacterium]|nr:cell division protein SepF [Clostridia bacterium]